MARTATYILEFQGVQVAKNSINDLIARNKSLIDVLKDLPQAGTEAFAQLDKELQEASNGTVNLEGVVKSLSTEFANSQKEIKGFGDALKNSLAQVGSLNALKEEAAKVNQELRNTKIGTEEYNNLLKKSGELTAEIKTAEEGIKAFGQELRKSVAPEGSINNLREQLKVINKELDNTKIGTARYRELLAASQAVTKELVEAENASGRFGRSVGNYGKVAQDLKANFLELGTAIVGAFGVDFLVGGLQQGVEQIIQTGLKFSDEIAKIRSLFIGASEAELARLEERARFLGQTTEFTSAEAAQALQEFAKAGLNVQASLNAVGPTLTLATAGNLSLAQSADIVAVALNSFQLSSDRTKFVVDILAQTANTAGTSVAEFGDALRPIAPLASSLGISFEEIAAAVGLLGDRGLRGSVATNTLRTAFSRLSGTNKEANAELEKLGVTAFDQQGKFIGLSELLLQLEGAFKNSTEEQKQFSLATIFGAEATTQLNVLLNGQKEIQTENGKELVSGAARLGAYAEQLRKTGEASKSFAEQVQQTQLDSAAGAVKLLESATEGLQLAIFDLIEDPLKGLIVGIRTAVESFQALVEGTSLVNRLLNENRNAIIIITGVLGTYVATIIAARIQTALLNVEEVKNAAFRRILTAVTTVYNTVVGVLTGRITLQTIATQLNTAATNANTIAGRIAATAYLLFTRQITFATAAQRLFNIVLSLNPIGIVITAVGLLATALVLLYRRFETVRNAFAGIGAVFNNLGNIIKNFIATRLEALGGIFAGIGKILSGEVKDGIEQIGAGINQYRQAGKDAATAAVNGFAEGYNDNAAKEALQRAGQDFQNSITGILSDGTIDKKFKEGGAKSANLYADALKLRIQQQLKSGAITKETADQLTQDVTDKLSAALGAVTTNLNDIVDPNPTAPGAASNAETEFKNRLDQFKDQAKRLQEAQLEQTQNGLEALRQLRLKELASDKAFLALSADQRAVIILDENQKINELQDRLREENRRKEEADLEQRKELLELNLAQRLNVLDLNLRQESTELRNLYNSGVLAETDYRNQLSTLQNTYEQNRSQLELEAQLERRRILAGNNALNDAEVQAIAESYRVKELAIQNGFKGEIAEIEQAQKETESELKRVAAARIELEKQLSEQLLSIATQRIAAISSLAQNQGKEAELNALTDIYAQREQALQAAFDAELVTINTNEAQLNAQIIANAQERNRIEQEQTAKLAELKAEREQVLAQLTNAGADQNIIQSTAAVFDERANLINDATDRELQIVTESENALTELLNSTNQQRITLEEGYTADLLELRKQRILALQAASVTEFDERAIINQFTARRNLIADQFNEEIQTLDAESAEVTNKLQEVQAQRTDIENRFTAEIEQLRKERIRKLELLNRGTIEDGAIQQLNTQFDLRIQQLQQAQVREIAATEQAYAQYSAKVEELQGARLELELNYYERLRESQQTGLDLLRGGVSEFLQPYIAARDEQVKALTESFNQEVSEIERGSAEVAKTIENLTAKRLEIETRTTDKLTALETEKQAKLTELRAQEVGPFAIQQAEQGFALREQTILRQSQREINLVETQRAELLAQSETTNRARLELEKDFTGKVSAIRQEQVAEILRRTDPAELTRAFENQFDERETVLKQNYAQEILAIEDQAQKIADAQAALEARRLAVTRNEAALLLEAVRERERALAQVAQGISNVSTTEIERVYTERVTAIRAGAANEVSAIEQNARELETASQTVADTRIQTETNFNNSLSELVQTRQIIYDQLKGSALVPDQTVADNLNKAEDDLLARIQSLQVESERAEQEAITRRASLAKQRIDAEDQANSEILANREAALNAQKLNFEQSLQLESDIYQQRLAQIENNKRLAEEQAQLQFQGTVQQSGAGGDAFDNAAIIARQQGIEAIASLDFAGKQALIAAETAYQARIAEIESQANADKLAAVKDQVEQVKTLREQEIERLEALQETANRNERIRVRAQLEAVNSEFLRGEIDQETRQIRIEEIQKESETRQLEIKLAGLQDRLNAEQTGSQAFIRLEQEVADVKLQIQNATVDAQIAATKKQQDIVNAVIADIKKRQTEIEGFINDTFAVINDIAQIVTDKIQSNIDALSDQQSQIEQTAQDSIQAVEQSTDSAISALELESQARIKSIEASRLSEDEKKKAVEAEKKRLADAIAGKKTEAAATKTQIETEAAAEADYLQRQIDNEKRRLAEAQKVAKALQALQAGLILVNSIAAVANAAAQSGAGAPVVVPLVIAAIASGVAFIKSLFADVAGEMGGQLTRDANGNPEFLYMEKGGPIGKRRFRRQPMQRVPRGRTIRTGKRHSHGGIHTELEVGEFVASRPTVSLFEPQLQWMNQQGNRARAGKPFQKTFPSSLFPTMPQDNSKGIPNIAPRIIRNGFAAEGGLAADSGFNLEPLKQVIQEGNDLLTEMVVAQSRIEQILSQRQILRVSAAQFLEQLDTVEVQATNSIVQ